MVPGVPWKFERHAVSEGRPASGRARPAGSRGNGFHATGGALAVPIPFESSESKHGRLEPPRPVLEAPPTHTSEEFAKYSDVELLVLFEKSGDERAFAELYHRHKSELYTYCVRMMSGDRDKASDIFQEVLIKVFEKASQFREGTNVAGWLYVIARNLCLNSHRNERAAERLDEPGPAIRFLASEDRSLAPEYDEEQHFLRRKLEEALAQLPLEFREPFMLREFDGFSYREIAAMTGATLGMTKVRIYRAKQRMRELLAPVLKE